MHLFVSSVAFHTIPLAGLCQPLNPTLLGRLSALASLFLLFCLLTSKPPSKNHCCSFSILPHWNMIFFPCLSTSRLLCLLFPCMGMPLSLPPFSRLQSPPPGKQPKSPGFALVLSPAILSPCNDSKVTFLIFSLSPLSVLCKITPSTNCSICDPYLAASLISTWGCCKCNRGA